MTGVLSLCEIFHVDQDTFLDTLKASNQDTSMDTLKASNQDTSKDTNASNVDAAIKIQRAWRDGINLALVGTEVHDKNVMIQSRDVYITIVPARTTHGAENIAAKTAPNLKDVGVSTGSTSEPQFICWVNKMNHGTWHYMCGASGDTLGRGNVV